MQANAIRQSFDKAAPAYDSHAPLQRQVLERLLSMVPCNGIKDVLDAGCGTGYLLKQKLPWRIVPLDLADGMCRTVAAQGHQPVQGRIEQLPFADRSFDLVFSSLAMQWLDDPAKFFHESARTLRPGGVLACATFTDGTLDELQHSFAGVDSYSHVLPFQHAYNLVDTLLDSGLRLLQMEQIDETEYFANLRAICERLRGLGANNKKGALRRGVMTPSQFSAAEKRFKEQFDNGVQWKAIYLVAQKPL
jgi:malonyl-CoA O-methyltransferase